VETCDLLKHAAIEAAAPLQPTCQLELLLGVLVTHPSQNGCWAFFACAIVFAEIHEVEAAVQSIQIILVSSIKASQI
jgi:hypothetical protein